MGRSPCCDKANVKKGAWSADEDAKLKQYKQARHRRKLDCSPPKSLRRCGKSCRLRWLNYLRPNIKHGGFSDEEDRIICGLYASIGSRWSVIAGQLVGRTDNDIKNYWNTKLKKKLGLALSNIFVQPPYNNNNNHHHPISSSSPSNNFISTTPHPGMFGSCSSDSPHHMDLWYFTNPTLTHQNDHTSVDEYSSSSSSAPPYYSHNQDDHYPNYSTIQDIQHLITTNTTLITDHLIDTQQQNLPLHY